VRTAADSVEVGDTVMFNYDIVPPKGKVVPGSVNVRWESSDTSVATVERGWVVGKKIGVATISATANGVRGRMICRGLDAIMLRMIESPAPPQRPAEVPVSHPNPSVPQKRPSDRTGVSHT